MRKKSRFKPGWLLVFFVTAMLVFVLAKSPAGAPPLQKEVITEAEYKIELISMDIRARGLRSRAADSRIYDVRTDYLFHNAGPACSARFDLPEWSRAGEGKNRAFEILENGIPVDFLSTGSNEGTDVGLARLESGWRSEFAEGEVKTVQVRYFLKPDIKSLADVSGNTSIDIAQVTHSELSSYSSIESIELPIEFDSSLIHWQGDLDVEISWGEDYPDFLTAAEPVGANFDGNKYRWHIEEPTSEQIFKVDLIRIADYICSLEDVRELVSVITERNTAENRKMLRVARNSVFARHGYSFGGGDMRKYFNSLKWYSPDPDYRDAMLTPEDREIIKTILDAEERLK
jgi:hypothetical protein